MHIYIYMHIYFSIACNHIVPSKMILLIDSARVLGLECTLSTTVHRLHFRFFASMWSYIQYTINFDYPFLTFFTPRFSIQIIYIYTYMYIRLYESSDSSIREIFRGDEFRSEIFLIQWRLSDSRGGGE